MDCVETSIHSKRGKIKVNKKYVSLAASKISVISEIHLIQSSAECTGSSAVVNSQTRIFNPQYTKKLTTECLINPYPANVENRVSSKKC
jgi:hypothetical protein